PLFNYFMPVLLGKIIKSALETQRKCAQDKRSTLLIANVKFQLLYDCFEPVSELSNCWLVVRRTNAAQDPRNNCADIGNTPATRQNRLQSNSSDGLDVGVHKHGHEHRRRLFKGAHAFAVRCFALSYSI